MKAESFQINEIRTKWVVLITTVAMVMEIWFGLSLHSMALLADGIHMGSHALAIGISWVAYIFIRKMKARNSKGDSDKVLSLSCYSNGLILLVFAVLILSEVIKRFYHPYEIFYKEAILVATLGLLVNLVCAFILYRKKTESDFNLRSAYLHVLADALTSISAILGLVLAMIWHIPWLDALGALLCSVVIIKWSAELLRDSGKNLLNIN
jgi:cation diffusion facilitator family transporter